jgi:alkanesulfonate monooxygenase SsuD/methylene tetrahydromethanopterin reductase-like flavin-dependent oxidoreductase (luciferase family)
VIIGGGGPRMLGVAAEHADIVAITANLRAGAVGEDAIADSMPEAYDRKIARVKEVAGDRFDSMEINSLAMNTSITDDRDGALEFFAQIFNAPKEVVAQSPALIAGSVGEIVETLQERRDRWGFNYVVVQQNGGQGMEQFSEVIAVLAGT